MSLLNINIIVVCVAILAALICCSTSSAEAKFLRRSRFYDDPIGGSPYDGNYGSSGVATGERALITVRGARNPYDGSVPSRLSIEDNPYRGAYPRGVYDRLDSSYSRGIGRRMPYYPGSDYSGYGHSGHSGYGMGYGSMYGAPNRIAVTGAFPY